MRVLLLKQWNWLSKFGCTTLSQIYPHSNWNSKLNTKLRLEFQVEYGLKLEFQVELLIRWESVVCEVCCSMFKLSVIVVNLSETQWVSVTTLRYFSVVCDSCIELFTDYYCLVFGIYNPWNKCSKIGLMTTGGQIPIEKHYRSLLTVCLFILPSVSCPTPHWLESGARSRSETWVKESTVTLCKTNLSAVCCMSHCSSTRRAKKPFGHIRIPQ